MSESTQKPGESTPIMHFRPRLFKELNRKTTTLKLDLFWTVSMEKKYKTKPTFYLPDDESSDEEGAARDRFIFPIHDLKPLLDFKNLKVLQLTGMMQSYQPLIWQAVWSNPQLSILTLEMATEPLFNTSSTHPNRVIDSSWEIFPSITPRSSLSSSNADLTALPRSASTTLSNPDDEPAYLGTTPPTGTLSSTFGSGEYLDTLAIKSALIAANNSGSLSATTYTRFLPIRHLTLLNVAVDGLPFLQWFDPNKLQTITFRSGCVDAGFYLHESMKHVRLVVPAPAATTTVGVARTVPAAELAAARAVTPLATKGLTLVELRGGKVVGEGSSGNNKRGLRGGWEALRGKFSRD